MNFEELLEAKRNAQANKMRLPMGYFCKQVVDGKYVNTIEIRPELEDNILFSEGLKTECEKNPRLVNKHQLHFERDTEAQGPTKLHVEAGNYLTLEALLRDNPAIVAQKGFIDDFVAGLFNIADYLHSQDIYHVCFSPANILVRKGDYSPMLLMHGSFYLGISETASLYEGFEDYVAPEVMEHGTIDERCDIYSLGKLLDAIFVASDMPYEYKSVAKKAQKHAPEDRYQSVIDMSKALKSKRSNYRSALTFVGALLIALLCVGLYFELMPQTNEVEFIKPIPKQPGDALPDEGIDPTAGLERADNDSADIMAADQQDLQRQYDAKAEEIFRKQFAQAADRILSRVYDNAHMNSSEKKFITEMSAVNEELLKAQNEIAEQSSLSLEKSQMIASEIIETLTEQKKKKLQYHGIQK